MRVNRHEPTPSLSSSHEFSNQTIRDFPRKKQCLKKTGFYKKKRKLKQPRLAEVSGQKAGFLITDSFYGLRITQISTGFNR
jgi:hypothetical protein